MPRSKYAITNKTTGKVIGTAKTTKAARLLKARSDKKFGKDTNTIKVLK